MSHEELEAARDYWSQIYQRLLSDPMATLIQREEAISQLRAGPHEAIAELYGFPAELTAELKPKYLDDLKSAPITSPGADPHAEFIFASLCRRVIAACNNVEGLNAQNVITGIEPRLGVFASRMGVLLKDASIATVGSQIFRFCNVVSKALAQTVAIDPLGWDNLEDLNAMRDKVHALRR
jgi:hypothetical protein